MKSLGFIGCGNMAGAMLRGALAAGIFQREQIIASDSNEEARRRAAETHGIETAGDNAALAACCETVVLAVKPQFYAAVIDEIRGALAPHTLVITIAPGWTLSRLEAQFGAPVHIVRAMPNTPAMVGAGMTAMCANAHVTGEELSRAQALLRSMGCVEIVPESLMDTVGAVSGSSPAYVYMFIEAMADAAVAGGMPRAMAYRFAGQAVLGSAKMVLESGRHPGDLKDMVCSPGGTTIEAVRVLEEKGMRGAVIDAMMACLEKTKKI